MTETTTPATQAETSGPCVTLTVWVDGTYTQTDARDIEQLIKRALRDARYSSVDVEADMRNLTETHEEPTMTTPAPEPQPTGDDTIRIPLDTV